MVIGKRGQKAYYDSMQGLVPGKVLDIDSDGRNVTIRVTADASVYKRGEVLTFSYAWVIPARAVRRRKYGASVRPYRWDGSKETGGASSVGGFTLAKPIY